MAIKNSNRATITSFGLQSGTDRTIFATWTWNKANTDKYDIRWYYATGDGVRFIGSQEEKSFANATPQSTYNAPANATLVKFQVRPISTTKKVNDKEVHHWTADWSTEKVYYFSNNPPSKPSAPTITIKDYTLTARLDNLDVGGKEIEFQVVQNDSTVYKTGTASIKTNSASYSCVIVAGSDYKVRCRAKKDKQYSEWSDYSSNVYTQPDMPSTITECQATSKSSVRLSWSAVSSAETYEIEYATKKEYLGASNAVTTISSIKTTTYEITGLASGDNYFFRVRAVNTQGTSTWTDPVSVTIGKNPSAPTTWSSTSTAIVGEDVILYWVHNTEDNSRETKAELRINMNGRESTISIKDSDPEDDENNNYILSTSGYPDGGIIKWKVRTAGVTGVFGDWSTERTIDIHAPASLRLNVTDNDGVSIDVVESFPFYIKGVAGPNSQQAIGYHVTIIANDSYETIDEMGNVKMVTQGQEIYSDFYNSNDDLVLELTPSSLDLENNIEYTVICVVTMDTGLNAEESLNFSVAWTDVTYAPNAEIIFDSETLCTHIRPYCEDYPIIYYKVNYNPAFGEFYRSGVEIDEIEGTVMQGFYTKDYNDLVYSTSDKYGRTVYFTMVESTEPILVENVSMAVYRRNYDGSFIEIGKGIVNTDNTYLTDPHPSLDIARYRIVATDDFTGAISYTDMPGYYTGVKSVILQWDETWSNFQSTSEEPLEEVAWAGSMLKLPYNIDISDSNTIDVSLVEYIGRHHPVSYYGTQLGTTSTWNVVIAKSDKNTLYGLRRLAIYTGDVYVREPSGSGYWAKIAVSFNQNHCETTIPVTLNITRVEGGV